MNAKEQIAAAKQGFEQSFAAGAFYNKQTQDADHLQQILSFLPLKSEMRVLDLGTGSGYLAFALAAAHPDIEITGLDIVEQALDVNRKRAAREQLANLHFVSYDGMDFPFADAAFDLVVSRYALHHFPDIAHSIGEVSRVLKPAGSFFLSDPMPNPCDTSGFADAFMRLKPDGHIRFYGKDDWIRLCGGSGMILSGGFGSIIRFPRKRSAENEYETLISQYPREVVESYDLQIAGDEIWITERVNNLLFRKTT